MPASSRRSGRQPLTVRFSIGFRPRPLVADAQGPARDRAVRVEGRKLRGKTGSTTRLLTDQAIVTLLESEGVKIARRTVAKYRDQLGILPARMRKRV